MERKYSAPKWCSHIYSEFLREKESIRFCFIVVFLWGMAAHAYGFVHCNLSHDVLNAFVASPMEETWKIMLGRYFVPVYRAIFRGSVTLPWLIGLWGLFWCTIAVYMVTRLLEMGSRFQTVLIAGIMVTNITFISQIATYLYEFDFNAFALVMAIGAVCLWRYKPGLLSCILGGICIMLSIGIYQSYVAVTVTLIIWISIMELLREKPVKQVFCNGLWGILMIALGGLFYFLIGKMVHSATGIALESRTDALYMEEGGSLLAVYIRLILPSIKDLGGNIVHPAYCRVPQLAAIVCILVFVTILTAWIIRRKKFTWDRILLIGVLCIALPFGINCVYFLAKGMGMHDLTVYAACFFYIIVLQLAFWVFQNGKDFSALAHPSVTATCLLVIWVLLQNVTLSNTAYVKKQMDVDSTFSTMTRVVSMLEQREDYVVGETKIALVGVPRNLASRPVFDKVRTITGVNHDSAFYSDKTSEYYNTYEAYFRYVMNYPVNLCAGEERTEKVMSRPEIEEMPIFPSTGCIQNLDGILVIKLSEP